MRERLLQRGVIEVQEMGIGLGELQRQRRQPGLRPGLPRPGDGARLRRTVPDAVTIPDAADFRRWRANVLLFVCVALGIAFGFVARWAFW